MRISEMRCGLIGKVSLLLFANEEQVMTGVFDMDGKPKNWEVAPFIKRQAGKGKQKPRADISYLGPGMIVLNETARAILGDTLLRFGQLLELDCEGEIEYMFNATCVIDALDHTRSECYEGTRTIKKASFVESAVPVERMIFKIPEAARSSIYVNDAAMLELQSLADRSGLTGLRFVEPGTRPY